MTQKFWKSMAFMGICFVLVAGLVEIYSWAIAH